MLPKKDIVTDLIIGLLSLEEKRYRPLPIKKRASSKYIHCTAYKQRITYKPLQRDHPKRCVEATSSIVLQTMKNHVLYYHYQKNIRSTAMK